MFVWLHCTSYSSCPARECICAYTHTHTLFSFWHKRTHMHVQNLPCLSFFLSSFTFAIISFRRPRMHYAFCGVKSTSRSHKGTVCLFSVFLWCILLGITFYVTSTQPAHTLHSFLALLLSSFWNTFYCLCAVLCVTYQCTSAIFSAFRLFRVWPCRQPIVWIQRDSAKCSYCSSPCTGKLSVCQPSFSSIGIMVWKKN